MMSPHLLLQAFWLIAPLISASVYDFSTDRFLQEFLVTKEFNGTVYLLSRRNRPIDKEAAKEVCHQSGGYLAKLDGGIEEFQHLKSTILESWLLAAGFLIDEVGNDIQPIFDFFDDFTGENCTFIRHSNNTNDVAVFDPSPCQNSAKFICEVPLTQADTNEAISTKDLLRNFHVSPVNQDKIYLILKKLKPFYLTDAMNTCQQFGGYLLRLKDRAEMHFVERLLGTFLKPKQMYIIYTSGNRRRDHETYVWGDSLEPINMPGGIPWGRNEPRGGFECMAILASSSGTFALENWGCSGSQYGLYVCEVDLQPL